MDVPRSSKGVKPWLESPLANHHGTFVRSSSSQCTWFQYCNFVGCKYVAIEAFAAMLIRAIVLLSVFLTQHCAASKVLK